MNLAWTAVSGQNLKRSGKTVYTSYQTAMAHCMNDKNCNGINKISTKKYKIGYGRALVVVKNGVVYLKGGMAVVLKKIGTFC